MRVLIIGIAGTGKSYLVAKMKKKGINAIDADSELVLAKFVNNKGEQVSYNPKGGIRWWSNHYYVLNMKVLKKVLKQNKTIYIFGNVGGQPSKGNGVFSVLELFDRVYYLKIPKRLIAKRLKTRANNIYGKHPEELKRSLANKDNLDKRAKKLKLKSINATLPTSKIIKIITS